jgi:hypothetical protein
MAAEMNTLTDDLAQARRAMERHEWRASYAAFVRADGVGPMPLDDLDTYARIAWRLGHGREGVRLAQRVYDQLVRTDPAAAAMKAVELNVLWRTRGHRALADDWAAKARLLVSQTSVSAAHGYLAFADAVAAIDREDADGLNHRMRTIDDVRRHIDDPALSVLGRVIEGVAAVLAGRDNDGFGILDAVLLPTLDARVPLEWGGEAYRLALATGERWGDVARVEPWIDSMQRWCDAVDAVAYRAICEVHRIRMDADRPAQTRRAVELQRAVVEVDADAMAILEELLAGGAR